MCLDVFHQSKENDKIINVTKCNSNSSQQWIYHNDQIKNMYSNKCVSLSDNIKAIQTDCRDNDSNQQWLIDDNNSIRNKVNQYYCLKVKNTSDNYAKKNDNNEISENNKETEKNNKETNKNNEENDEENDKNNEENYNEELDDKYQITYKKNNYLVDENDNVYDIINDKANKIVGKLVNNKVKFFK